MSSVLSLSPGQWLCFYRINRTLESKASRSLWVSELLANSRPLAILVTEGLSEQFMNCGLWGKFLGFFPRNMWEAIFNALVIDK